MAACERIEVQSIPGFHGSAGGLWSTWIACVSRKSRCFLVCLVTVWERFLFLQRGMLGHLTRDLETQNLGF